MYSQIKLSYPKVKILVVTKTKSIDEINNYYNKGIYEYGENKSQELLTKIKYFPLAKWHFIGHLQTKKVKQIIKYIEVIESVDSEKLLLEINKQAERINKIQNIYLELSLTTDENKTGFNKNDIAKILQLSRNLKNVLVTGIMVMGPLTNNITEIEQVFSIAQQIFNTYSEDFGLINLSMGMSNDYAIASKFGSTEFRLGSILF